MTSLREDFDPHLLPLPPNQTHRVRLPTLHRGSTCPILATQRAASFSLLGSVEVGARGHDLTPAKSDSGSFLKF